MNATRFREFFRAIHGTDPFPWQQRLAEKVCETGAWPRVIDLPTGSGKTACIDVALFHFLSCAHSAPARARRRIAFVVDRRIIVDEAAARARKIQAAIEQATSVVLAEARATLIEITGTPRIDVKTLRGGVVKEKNLVRDPATATVVLSTVDQIGSRLLFRGYGVSDKAKPMHAGMYGFDTLLLLDEAHIAEPFRQTLEGIVREQARSERVLDVLPLSWAQLSATPTQPPDFTLDEADRTHPVLAARLGASKPLRLVEVDKRDELPGTLLKLVGEELASPPITDEEPARIAVIVNRVLTARTLVEQMRKKLDADVELVIGRTRPIDRDRLMNRLTPLLKSSAEARGGERPIVVVATQTLEVGADFDFHAMFVEAASFAAMKQRVGRLNRLGIRPSARGAIVLVRADATDDPVYGRAIQPSWDLLGRHARDGVVDLGIAVAPAATSETALPPPHTPELVFPHVALLVQTNPRPKLEPDVASYLHGYTAEQPEVSVVWRDGIGSSAEIDRAVLEALPPLSREAMSLPLSTFRMWASRWESKKRVRIPELSDMEGGISDGNATEIDDDALCYVFRDEEVVQVRVRDVRPAEVVVVPSSRGGADAFGFAPDSDARVEDLSQTARADAGRSATLVWTRSLATAWQGERTTDGYAQSVDALVRCLGNDDGEARDLVLEWAAKWSDVLPAPVALTLTNMGADCLVEALVVNGEVQGVTLRARRPTSGDLVDAANLQRSRREVLLEEHGRGVAQYAERFAKMAGFDQPMTTNLRVAGRIHDVGKAEPRFQAMLDATPDRVLAKSPRFDRHVRIGARHECYSVAVADRYPALFEDASDTELVRYLVGSHHGYGRGMQPMVEDRGASFDVEVEGSTYAYVGRPGLDDLDSGWAGLFVRLTRRYGPWGLAYLETIVRLADHRRSEDELLEENDA